MLIAAESRSVSSADGHRLGWRERLTIRRILRVNHAGECGAIRIYEAQIEAAKQRAPAIVPELEAVLAHEIEHCGRAELHAVIGSIQAEELVQLQLARSHLPATTPMNGWLAILIQFATDALIWLSTYGAPSRMAADLRKAKAAT